MKDSLRRAMDLWVFLGLDHKAVEIRMLAELSGDPVLIKYFKSGKDIHCLVGHDLTGWSVDKIASDKQTRRSIKEFHFSLVYGVGENNMHSHMKAKGVKITRARVRQYYRGYFRKYKGVDQFIKKCRRTVEVKHKIPTLFGFEIPIERGDARRGSYWANRAVNSPVQGSAHQLLLIALAILKQKPKTYNLLRRWPLMEVHDALYFKVKLKDVRKAYQQAKHLLETATVEYIRRKFKYRMRVPLVAEASVGFTLGAMVEYEGGPVLPLLREWQKKYREAADKPITLEELLPDEILKASGRKTA